jgi:hypothetical protein
VIGKAPSTMKKFVLKLTTAAWIWEIEKILKLKRKYHSISIEQDEPIFTYATRKVLAEHGTKLRTFKLTKASVVSLQDLLQFTPLLESLELENISLTNTKDQQQPIDLPHLKHLKIDKCSDEILNLISGAKYLSNLEIVSYENREIVMKFLMKHPTIKSFSIGYKVFENFLQNEDVMTIPFRLQKLEFAGYPISVIHENCLKKFIKLHAPTLNHIRNPHIVSTEIHQIVFNQIPNLKTVSINVESLPTEKSFYCCMSPLEKVTKLRLHGKFPKHEVAKLFIANFPSVVSLNMKYLKCSIWFMKFLQKISQHQKNIVHLKIPNFFKGTPNNLHFKHLKTLRVNTSQNLPFWKNFVHTHSSTIEEITVNRLHEEGKFKSKDIEDLLELPMLRRLTMNGDSKVVDEIWAVIRADYKQLKRVDFHITSIKSSAVDKKIIFPHDKQYWLPEKYNKSIVLIE